MEMADMKMTAEEQKEYSGPVAPMGGGPKYPYGLEIRLEDAGIRKLGLPALPAVGQEMMLMARVSVVTVSQHQDQAGIDRSLCLQITKMMLHEAPAEKSTAEVMYPKAV